MCHRKNYFNFLIGMMGIRRIRVSLELQVILPSMLTSHLFNQASAVTTSIGVMQMTL